MVDSFADFLRGVIVSLLLVLVLLLALPGAEAGPRPMKNGGTNNGAERGPAAASGR